jgi:hypothetical protein
LENSLAFSFQTAFALHVFGPITSLYQDIHPPEGKTKQLKQVILKQKRKFQCFIIRQPCPLPQPLLDKYYTPMPLFRFLIPFLPTPLFLCIPVLVGGATTCVCLLPVFKDGGQSGMAADTHFAKVVVFKVSRLWLRK